MRLSNSCRATFEDESFQDVRLVDGAQYWSISEKSKHHLLILVPLLNHDFRSLTPQSLKPVDNFVRTNIDYLRTGRLSIRQLKAALTKDSRLLLKILYIGTFENNLNPAGGLA